MDLILDFLTGTSPYHAELRTFGHALFGAMAVRNGPNKQRKMKFFHAFALSTIVGFGGGWFTPLWMGKPTTMISGGDVNFALALIAFVIVNHTPGDIGYMTAKSFPGALLTTLLAQAFRAFGQMGFISVAAKELSPSAYYPIPIVGPVLYGCLLSTMGAFFLKGVDGVLGGGLPWPFQSCMFIGTFFHLFTHDQEGPLGTTLRGMVYSVVNPALLGEIDDRKFATFVMASFMQITGVLMMPQFLGPSFNILAAPFSWLQNLTAGSSNKKKVPVVQKNAPAAAQNPSKKKKKNKKKKKQA